MATKHDADDTSKKFVACGPCLAKDKKSTSKPSSWYCQDCDEFLCIDCKAFHQSFRANRSHKLVTGRKASEKQDAFRTLSEKAICKIHRDRKLELYCPSHEMFCCTACVGEAHSRCKNVCPIENHEDKIVGQDMDKLKLLFGELAKLLESLEQLDKKCLRFLDQVLRDIPQQFKQMKQILLYALDKAEESAKRNAVKLVQRERNKTAIHKKKCFEMRQTAEKAISVLEVASRHGSNRQTTILQHELLTQATDLQIGVSVAHAASADVRVEIDINEQLLLALEEAEKVFSITVKGMRQSGAITTTGPQETKQVQLIPKFRTQFDVRGANDHRNPCIVGFAFLPDGSLLLSDSNNKAIKHYDKEFEFIQAKEFDSKPADLAVFDRSEFAICFPEKKKIRRHMFTSGPTSTEMEKTGTIFTGIQCHGIDYVNKEKIVVTSLQPPALCVYSTNGDEIYRVVHNKKGHDIFSEPRYVTIDAAKTRAYVSDSDGDKVVAIDLKTYGLIFTYQHAELERPQGISVNADGSIFVCGTNSENVHQIISAGGHLSILLNQVDGVVQPACIAITQDGGSFILSDDGSNIKIFDI